MAEENGKKFDQDWHQKPKMGLVPQKALWEVAKVMSYGASKYAAYNWLGGIKYSRLYDAAMRHLNQFVNGEDLDSETSVSHLAHCACCILMLLEMTIRRPDMDDRYKESEVTKPIEETTKGLTCRDCGAWQRGRCIPKADLSSISVWDCPKFELSKEVKK